MLQKIVQHFLFAELQLFLLNLLRTHPTLANILPPLRWNKSFSFSSFFSLPIFLSPFPFFRLGRCFLNFRKRGKQGVRLIFEKSPHLPFGYFSRILFSEFRIRIPFIFYSGRCRKWGALFFFLLARLTGHTQAENHRRRFLSTFFWRCLYCLAGYGFLEGGGAGGEGENIKEERGGGSFKKVPRWKKGPLVRSGIQPKYFFVFWGTFF